MNNLFLLIFSLFGLFGMATIAFRKIPVLINLPEGDYFGESLFSKIKTKIKNSHPLKNFSFLLFLQKLLFKIRILILKLDNLTFMWLNKVREKTKKLKFDNYWEEIKKIKQKKGGKPA